MAHYIVFTGGRDTVGSDVDEAILDVLTFMRSFYGPDLGVMHGAARGVDSAVGKIATDLGIKVKAFPADWDTHGKAAGPKRNIKMVNLLVGWEQRGHSTEVIAFPGGIGTEHCCSFAEQCGINVTRIPLERFGVSSA